MAELITLLVIAFSILDNIIKIFTTKNVAEKLIRIAIMVFIVIVVIFVNWDFLYE